MSFYSHDLTALADDLHPLSKPSNMSAPEATYTFPAPVGGVPFDLDFAPSILFSALYGLVSLLAIYRFARSSSRTMCTFGALAFTVERSDRNLCIRCHQPLILPFPICAADAGWLFSH